MGLYNQIYLKMNGVLLAENTTIESALEADVQDVFTIVRNWSGITPAPIVRSATGSNVIPLSGVEFNFEQKMMDFELVGLGLWEGGLGGKSCLSDGYITNVPRSAGVGQTTTISFSFRGTPSAFE